MQAADAIARALGTVASIRHVETLPSGKSDAAALGRGAWGVRRDAAYRPVAAVGRDSARFRFPVLDAQTGRVRTLAVDMPNTPDDADLRAALDPVLSTLLFVSHPSMGAATLPLGAPPRFEAARELATALDIGAGSDSVSRDAALPHYLLAATLDSTFVGARLWRADFIQSRFSITYSIEARAIGDTIMRDVAPRLDRLTPFEHAYYDVIVAVHLGQVAEEVAALRRLRALAPQVPTAGTLPLLLLDQNRPREALDILRSSPPSRDRDGRVIPAKDDAERWRLISRIEHYLGDRARDVEAANELRRLVPDDIVSVRAQLIASTWDGDSSHIEDLLNAARSMPRQAATYNFYGGVVLQVGQELIRHGHRKLGEQLEHRAVEWFVSRPPNEVDRLIQFRKALAYHAVHDEAKAAEALGPLLRADSASIIYIGLAGRIAAMRGDTAEAERRLRQLAAIDGRGLQGTHAGAGVHQCGPRPQGQAIGAARGVVRPRGRVQHVVAAALVHRPRVAVGLRTLRAFAQAARLTRADWPGDRAEVESCASNISNT